MKTIIILTSLLVNTVWASRYGDEVYVDVIDVQPIFETHTVPERREVCHRIPEQEHHTRNRTGSSILGGIIGGAIGNRFGRGSGRDVATVAGVMIGASVGSNHNRNNRQRRYDHVETRCYIDTVYSDEEQLVAYDVSYRYNGEIRYIEMLSHPGKQIKLRVDVSVVE